jgi:hypothetical protein
MENLRWISKVAVILPYVIQDSALCGEAHGTIMWKMHTWGVSLQLQGKDHENARYRPRPRDFLAAGAGRAGTAAAAAHGRARRVGTCAHAVIRDG